MKRLTLLSLWFCFVYCCLSAQHLNLAWQPEFFNTPYRIEPIADGWVVAGELFDRRFDPRGPHITRIGAGEIRWRKRWEGGIPNDLSVFAVLPGNRVVVSGLQGVCDTSGDRFFIIYDDDGEEIYIKYEDADRDSFVWIPYVSELRNLPGGGYLGLNNFQVLTFNDTLGYRDHIGVNWPDEYLRFLTQTNDSTFWTGFRNYRDGYWQVLPFITRGYNLRRGNGWAPFDLALGDTLLDLKTYKGSVYALARDAIWENRPPYQTPVAHPFGQAMEFRNQYFDSGFELCFWVSDADGHLEKDYDNNLYCQVLPLESAGMPEDSWNIHPNPVREELWIGFSPSTSMAGKLRVYNAVGQQVLLSPLSAQSLSYRLPVDRLAAGLYLLEWENGEERLVKRFVKR